MGGRQKGRSEILEEGQAKWINFFKIRNAEESTLSTFKEFLHENKRQKTTFEKCKHLRTARTLYAKPSISHRVLLFIPSATIQITLKLIFKGLKSTKKLTTCLFP